MRKDSLPLLLVAACHFIAATAAGQSAPTPETSSLLANPGLSPGARQAIQERVDTVHANFRASHGGLGPEHFGVECCQITQIPAAAFSPVGAGEAWDYDSSGYIYPQGSSNMWAPVLLPSGVEITFLDFYYFDAGVENIHAILYGFFGGGPFSGEPTTLSLATAHSSGNSGFGFAVAPLSHTVNNNVAFDPSAAQLAVVVDCSCTGPSFGFKAVELWWMRQVSEAPATASFSDVPTTHPYFQFVEALVAAGITGGCGGNPPLYCVDAPLTRGQMAVFLSKALGLYWPL